MMKGETKKQKSHSPELISRPIVTTASQVNDTAKVQKIIETIQENLKIVAEKYKGINDPEGFVTNLKKALGMNLNKSSNYRVFMLNKQKVSLRVSNHHANAKKYLEHMQNDFNLSIMISKRYRKNRFQSHPMVKLKEYVYMGHLLKSVDSPYSQIALSLIDFFENGEYVDTTGIAKVNESP